MTSKPTRGKGTTAPTAEDAAAPARTSEPASRNAAPKKRAPKPTAAGPQGAVAAKQRKAKAAGKAPPLPPKGHDVDPATLEFIAAIDAYKSTHSRPFPGWSEILHVARWLGYRKPDA